MKTNEELAADIINPISEFNLWLLVYARENGHNQTKLDVIEDVVDKFGLCIKEIQHTLKDEIDSRNL